MNTTRSHGTLRRLISACAAVAISLGVLSASAVALHSGDKEVALARQQAVAQQAQRAHHARIAIEDGITFAVSETPNRATN
jgi:hypothetical protein